MSKDRLFGSVLVVCMSVAMITCNLEDQLTTEGVEGSITSQTFSGRVIDGNGTAVAGARVTINGISRITGSTGQYAVVIADSRTGYRFDIRKDGFGPVTDFRLAGELSLVHRMQAGFTKIIKPNVTNVVIDPSGVQVTIPANGLRSATGLPAGDVRFTIIPHTSQTMPGDFTARTATGAPVALVSVGAVTLQAVDSQNNTLGLTAGVLLNVKLPVPSAAGGTMPTCVLTGACRTVLWRFTPSTSLWVEQAVVSPAFTTTVTTFGLRGQSGVIDPADGLGTWNADIEFTNPACTVIVFSSLPLDCYNPPPGATPEPGITVSFTQALSGGGTKSKTSAVLSSAAFLVLYNLRPNVDVDLSFTFPAGAPASCAANLVFSSSPAPSPGFPVLSPTGGATRVSSGAPWGGTGYPTDPGGLPIDFVDVAVGDDPCNSRVLIATSP
jgi:hypothetical protein